jgi:hypothetical protein
MVWRRYDDSAVLNAIYAVFRWKGEPGTVDVELGDEGKIKAETDKETLRLWDVFLVRAAKGPREVKKFLESKEIHRADCLGTIQQVFRDAGEINRDIIEETKRGIIRLSAIKCASTVVLKTAGLFAPAPAFLVSIGYDVALDVIKDWDKAEDAGVVGVATKTAATEGSKELAQKFAEEEAEYLAAKAEGAAEKAEWIKKRLDALEAQIARKINAGRVGKMEAKAAQYSRRLNAAESVVKAGKKAALLSAVKYVFFAWDIYNAGKDAYEETHGI